MQRFFSIIVIFGILVVGGGYLYNKKSDEEARMRIEDTRSKARRTFADKARSAIREEDDSDYVRTIQTALRSYDEELKKRVYDKKPKWRDPAGYKKKIDAMFKEGKIKEIQHKNMTEGYKIVRSAYDKIMGATWKPVMTAKGAGDTRLDIYEMRRARDDEGNPILEGRFVFWGIEDNSRVNWGGLSMRYWTKRTKEVKKGRKKVEEEIEEVLGRADGDAQPRIIMQTPSKYVADFPSYVAIGYIWLPVMPKEAHAVDIEYGYTLKKGGTSHDALLKWEKFQIPSGWKLKEGEVWDADVIEATEDEIAGKEPGEEGENAEGATN